MDKHKWASRHKVAKPRKKMGLGRRIAAMALSGALLAGGAVATATIAPTAAVAATNGPGVSGLTGIPNGWIGGYKLASGVIVYCTERGVADPYSSLPSGKELTKLPSYKGYDGIYGATSAPAMSSKADMRQLNFMLDKYGQTSNGYTAAGLAVAVWDLRGDKNMNKIWSALNKSAKGKKVAAKAKEIRADGKKHRDAAPKSPKKPSGSVKIKLDKNGKKGTVTFPKGTVKLSLTGAKFGINDKATTTMSGNAAGERRFNVNTSVASKKSYTVKVDANWKTTGAAGWEPKVKLWRSTNPREQAVAGTTGQVSAKNLTGKFSDKVIFEREDDKLKVTSQAQPAAELGGTMTDTAALTGTVPANGQVDFTAYLQPVAGGKKYDSNWNTIAGDEVERQVEGEYPKVDPETGEPEVDENGEPVMVFGPLYDENGDPIMETVREDQTWTQEELDGMSAAERCVVQPVYSSPRQAAGAPGRYTSPQVEVKTAGTIYWSERFYAGSTLKHTGKCGLSNEKTVVDMPGVETKAVENAVVGDVITDTAIVSGKLNSNAKYEIRVDAYKGTKAPELEDEEGEADETGENTEVVDFEAVCNVDNHIFGSEYVPVTSTGDIEMPGFVAKWEHGEVIWWVETLVQVDDEGEREVLHRGECGLENETTEIGRPDVETKAQETAVVGDTIKDTAIVTGELAENDNASYEVVFEGYKATYTEDENGEKTPVCEVENKLFTTKGTKVTGPGEYDSEAVKTTKDMVGNVWWVEKLILKEAGEEPQVIHTGECGLVNETTEVTTPEVTTKAVEKAFMGDDLYDTAIVTGELSQREGVKHEVAFELYEKTFDDAGNPVCEVDNKIDETGATAVTAAGEYESERILAKPEHVGTIWWVETLWADDGKDRVEIHRGECGLENETTIVERPEVTTTAVPDAVVGDKIWDVAHVTAPISDREGLTHEVKFEAFQQPEGATEPVCTVDNRVFESEPVAVTKPGDYKSESFTTEAKHVGTIYWIETLSYEYKGEKVEIAKGECGAKNEITKVTSPKEPLADTGGASNNALLIGAGLLVLLGGAAAAISIARRRDRAEIASE